MFLVYSSTSDITQPAYTQLFQPTVSISIAKLTPLRHDFIWERSYFNPICLYRGISLTRGLKNVRHWPDEGMV